jgi:hypothetical protein
MKVSVVPAQVTTIEDRIAGNLGLSQLLLLALPIFGGSLLYIILPPNMHAAAYKLTVIVLLSAISCLMAIRIRGKILLHWLVVILRYNSRPSHYVYDRRSLAGRHIPRAPKQEEKSEETKSIGRSHKLVDLTIAEIARAKALMEEPAANLSFKVTRKGGLHVLISEVKDQV